MLSIGDNSCARCQSLQLPCSLLEEGNDDGQDGNSLSATLARADYEALQDRLHLVEKKLEAHEVAFAMHGLALPQNQISNGNSRAPSPHPNDAYEDYAVPLRGIKALSSAVDASPGSGRRALLEPVQFEPDPSDASPVISSILIGNKRFDFPVATVFEDDIDYFFQHILPFFPCIDGPDFKSKCSALTDNSQQTSNHFVALVYAVLATVAIVKRSSKNAKKASQRWHMLCEELRHRAVPRDRNDLSPIQTLIFQATYLSFCSDLNAAYLTSGYAARLCFQYGLHNVSQSDSIDMQNLRQRVFFTVFFVERRIAQSCGRPYAIRDLDVGIPEPSWIKDVSLATSSTALPGTTGQAALSYLRGQVSFVRFCAQVWDSLYAASLNVDLSDDDKTMLLDQQIQTWLEYTFPVLFLSSDYASKLAEHQKVIIETLMLNLRLIFRRHRIVSLNYDKTWAQISGHLANTILTRILRYEADANSGFFKFHAVTISPNPLLVLASLILRGNLPHSLHTTYVQTFKNGTRLLMNSSGPAQRIKQDMGDLIQSVLQQIETESLSNPSTLASLDSYFAQGPNLAVIPPPSADLSATPDLFSSFNFPSFAESSQISYDPDLWARLLSPGPGL